MMRRHAKYRTWLHWALRIPSPSYLSPTTIAIIEAGWQSRTDAPDTPGPVSTGLPPEV